MPVPKVHLDFEVRSPSPLGLVGVYNYAADPETYPICLAYLIDDADPVVWIAPYFAELLEEMGDAPQGDTIGPLFRAIAAGAQLHAWNATFEKVIWRLCEKLFDFPPVPIDRWRCSMAAAARVGLPLGLDACAKAVGALRKDKEGAQAMRSIVSPIKRSEDAGQGTLWTGPRHEFNESPALIRKTLAYCIDDVESERDVARKVPTMTEAEVAVWQLDQRINERGIAIDRDLCDAAVDLVFGATAEGGDDIKRITDGAVERPTQGKRIIAWCLDQGVRLTDLRADTVEGLLDGDSLDDVPQVRQVLQLRAAGSKSSTAKFARLLDVANADDRLRGSLQYCGAFTGRWAGRVFQPHNLPRGAKLHSDNYDEILELFRRRDKDLIELLYGPAGTVAKSVLRGAICASPGHLLCVWDFSQIEARVLAWVAGDHAALKPFADGDDPYRAMAAKIYAKPIEDVTGYERLIGKIAILGLGYQMGAMRFYESLPEGSSFDFAEFVVRTFRSEFHRIRHHWYATESAAIEAVANPGRPMVVDGTAGRLAYLFEGDFLRCRLPSGRCIFYYKPKLSETIKFNRSAIELSYLKRGKGAMIRTTTYGGKLVENNTQAIARDVMAEGMLRVDAAGTPIVLTVHDEALGDVPEDEAEERLEEGRRLLCVNEPWNVGLPIAADDPFICFNYRKG